MIKKVQDEDSNNQNSKYIKNNKKDSKNNTLKNTSFTIKNIHAPSINKDNNYSLNKIPIVLKKENILLVGTNHVSKLSSKEIEKKFNEFNPDIICIELDKQRLRSMLSNEKAKMSFKLIKVVGLTGFLFAAFGQIIQKKLAKKYEVKPGIDMLSSFELARKYNKNLYLIDQNIQITLKRLSIFFSFKEKFRIFTDTLKGLLFPKKMIKKMELEHFNLENVPKDTLIEKLIGYVEKRYPNLYKVLIHERNVIMVNNIINIMKQNPNEKLLITIGAGHKKGMNELFDTYFEKQNSSSIKEIVTNTIPTKN